MTLGVPATAASCITSGRIDVALTAAWFAFVVAVGRVPGGGQAVSELLADRAQMGTSLGFHIVFAPRVISPPAHRRRLPRQPPPEHALATRHLDGADESDPESRVQKVARSGQSASVCWRTGVTGGHEPAGTKRAKRGLDKRLGRAHKRVVASSEGASQPPPCGW